MECKRRIKLWAQNINGKKRRSDMEGMLDNPRNILLWITSESTSSESQNSLFVELHHTSIICLTSRSIKLMIEALFCSGNYMFSVLHNCYRYLYQYRRPCWADTTARSAAVCGCCCCLSSGHWADCLSPLPAADTAHTAAWPQLYTRSQSAPLAFLQGKKFWPPNGCLHDKNHFKIE